MTVCHDCHSLNVEDHKSKVKLADGMEVMIEYAVCPMCPREFIPKEMILRNEEAIRKARDWELRREENNR